MVLGLWKPTAVEGSVSSCLCSLCLHLWCVGDGNQELLFLKDISPGAAARRACSVPLPQFPQPVGRLSQPWEGMAAEDTRWQQRAVCAERAGRCPHCRVLPWPNRHRRASSPLSLGHRPPWASVRGAVSAAGEWDTPPCPRGGGGAAFLGGFLGLKLRTGGFREGMAGDAQGSLRTPGLWEFGWEELEGLQNQGWVGESPPCPGHIGVSPGV